LDVYKHHRHRFCQSWILAFGMAPPSWSRSVPRKSSLVGGGAPVVGELVAGAPVAGFDVVGLRVGD